MAAYGERLSCQLPEDRRIGSQCRAASHGCADKGRAQGIVDLERDPEAVEGNIRVRRTRGRHKDRLGLGLPVVMFLMVTLELPPDAVATVI
jgi:hypothetical protein